MQKTSKSRSTLTPLIIAIGAALLLPGGCSKSGGGGGGGAPVTLSIAKLKLKVTAPKGSKVIDMMGDPAVKFPDGSMITLNKPTAIDEAKVDAAIKDIKGSYKGASGFKKHTLASGWAITYINKAPIGTMHMVKARLTFGKQTWNCVGSSKSTAQQTMALEACKSLKQ